MQRFSHADLPEIIPIFPLAGALLLPRARLPLNIFEPRYLAMLDDALKSGHRLIGMIQPLGSDDTPPLQRIGCAGRVTSFTETEDGRYLVVLTGVSRFRVAEEVEGFAPYRRLHADWAGFDADLEQREDLPNFDRDALLLILRDYFDVVELALDWDSVAQADPGMLIDSLSMVCPFAPEEKQALLEAPDLANRAETLVTLMRFAIAGAGGGEGRLQ
ncbi:MAG TPA: LON peptidase substrate-binding domain-containing protein [Paracoccaceae bacterium]|nr:LON peptidase substrate-binding domain-containing protein [Paracoccaceae bacterium]